MAKLNYDMSVTGSRNVEKALSSVESRIVRLNAKMARMKHSSFLATKGGSDPAKRGMMMAQWERRELTGAKRVHQAKLRMIRTEAAARMRAEKAAAAASIAAAKKVQASRVGFMRSTVGNARGMYGGAGRAALGGLAMVGGFGGYEAVRSEMGIESASIAMANQAAGNTDSKKQIRAQAQQIANRAKAIGGKSGRSPAEVIYGMAQVQAMAGDTQMAMKSADFITEFADATGSGLGDSATMMSRLFMSANKKNSGIANEDERRAKSLGDAKSIMMSLGGQGKAGSVEVADFANQIAKLTQIAGGVKDGTFAENMEKLGAITQLVASESTGPEELLTSMGRFNDYLKSSGGKDGLKVTGKDGKKQTIDVMGAEGTRNPVDVLLDLMDATGGDMTKLQSGNIRAQRVIDPISMLFRAANDKGKGGEALRGELERMRSMRLTDEGMGTAAGATRQTQERALGRFKADLSAKVGESLIKAFTIEGKDGERKLDPALTDAINQLVAALPGLIAALGKMAEFAIKNPKTTAAIGLLGAPLGKTVGGQLLEAGIEKVAGIGMANAGALAGGTGGAVKTLGVAGGAKAAVAALGTVGQVFMVKDSFEATKEETGSTGWAATAAAAAGTVAVTNPITGIGYGAYKAFDYMFGDDSPEKGGEAQRAQFTGPRKEASSGGNGDSGMGAAADKHIAAAAAIAKAAAQLAASARQDPTENK